HVIDGLGAQILRNLSLPLGQKSLGLERSLTGQSQRRSAIKKGHQTSSMIIPRRRFSISIRAVSVTIFSWQGTAVMALAPLDLATSKCATQPELRGKVIMPSYSPELIQTMRAALDEVMTKIPLEQATPGIKAAVAECILKAAANGQTSYDGLIAAASEQIQ